MYSNTSSSFILFCLHLGLILRPSDSQDRERYVAPLVQQEPNEGSDCNQFAEWKTQGLPQYSAQQRLELTWDTQCHMNMNDKLLEDKVKLEDRNREILSRGENKQIRY